MNEVEAVKAFNGLNKAEQERMLQVAGEKARAGKCFMCEMIVDKKGYEHFPKPARAVHILNCVGTNESKN